MKNKKIYPIETEEEINWKKAYRNLIDFHIARAEALEEEVKSTLWKGITLGLIIATLITLIFLWGYGLYQLDKTETPPTKVVTPHSLLQCYSIETYYDRDVRKCDLIDFNQ